MNSFNVFTQKSKTIGGNVPVWLGTVAPVVAGGTLVAKWCKAGVLIPAGTPVHYNDAERAITPLAMWEVVSVDASAHAITIKAGTVAPEVNDVLTPVGATFDTTGAAGKVASVAAAANGNIVVTMTSSQLDSMTPGKVLSLAAGNAAASGASLAFKPNAYLYNDICIESLEAGQEADSIAASGAVVRFHGEGILIDRTPAAGFAAQMAAAVPGVAQIKG